MQPKLEGHTPTYRIPAHLKFSSNTNKTEKIMVSKFDENQVFSQFLCTNNGFEGYVMIWNHSEAKNQISEITGFSQYKAI